MFSQSNISRAILQIKAIMKNIRKTLFLAIISIVTINASAWPWTSPYAYCVNNPIAVVDPDGREIFFYQRLYWIWCPFSRCSILECNAFQANDITTIYPHSNATITTDYQNTDDWVINQTPFVSSPGDIHGADFKIREPSKDSDWKTRHRSPIDIQGGDFWLNLRSKQLNNSFVDSPTKLYP